VFEYVLSAAWDLSTASYNSSSFYIGGQESEIFGHTFSIDGTKMYIVGFSADTIYQYTLSTAFDLSSASFSSKSYGVGFIISEPTDIAFNENGTKMFVSGRTPDSVHQFALSTAWDVSTASYDSASFNIAQQTNLLGICFGNNGAKQTKWTRLN
jgi:DNA-binding beta-propeller fold protein YncE